MENAVKQGFHMLNYNHVFLANGVNTTCTLQKHNGLEDDVIEQGFFAGSILEAMEGVSKFIAITYLGFREVWPPLSERTAVIPNKTSAKVKTDGSGNPNTKNRVEEEPPSVSQSHGILKVTNAYPYLSLDKLMEMFGGAHATILEWVLVNKKFYFKTGDCHEATLVRDKFFGMRIPQTGKLLEITYVTRFPEKCETYIKEQS